MLMNCLSKVSDPRRRQGKRYKLEDILAASILAILSGAKAYRDIVRFIDSRLKPLEKYFGIKWKRAPSKSNLRDVICGVDNKSLEDAFREYSQLLLQESSIDPEKLRGVGIDGKVLRGSFDNAKGNTPLQLLNSFCTESKLILNHVEIEKKTNEIPVAQQLIAEFNLPEGSIYTLDAMHCQKKPSKPLKKRSKN